MRDDLIFRTHASACPHYQLSRGSNLETFRQTARLLSKLSPTRSDRRFTWVVRRGRWRTTWVTYASHRMVSWFVAFIRPSNVVQYGSWPYVCC